MGRISKPARLACPRPRLISCAAIGLTMALAGFLIVAKSPDLFWISQFSSSIQAASLFGPVSRTILLRGRSCGLDLPMVGEWFPVRKSSQDTLEHHYSYACARSTTTCLFRKNEQAKCDELDEWCPYYSFKPMASPVPEISPRHRFEARIDIRLRRGPQELSLQGLARDPEREWSASFRRRPA